MTLRRIERYEHMLRKKRSQLRSVLLAMRRLLLMEKCSDPLEEWAAARERELAAAVMERKSVLIRQIDEALERISKGNYGYCLDCGGPIGDMRLLALPWASLCLDCQLREEETYQIPMIRKTTADIAAWLDETETAGIEGELALSASQNFDGCYAT